MERESRDEPLLEDEHSAKNLLGRGFKPCSNPTGVLVYVVLNSGILAALSVDVWPPMHVWAVCSMTWVLFVYMSVSDPGQNTSIYAGHLSDLQGTLPTKTFDKEECLPEGKHHCGNGATEHFTLRPTHVVPFPK